MLRRDERGSTRPPPAIEILRIVRMLCFIDLGYAYYMIYDAYVHLQYLYTFLLPPKKINIRRVSLFADPKKIFFPLVVTGNFSGHKPPIKNQSCVASQGGSFTWTNVHSVRYLGLHFARPGEVDRAGS